MPSKITQRPKASAERAERRGAERKLMAAAVYELRSSEGWQRWLRVRSHFHTYSLHNQLLIAHQQPAATRVAGFRSWLDLGYVVCKGERGIAIWAPCVPSKKKMRRWREAGEDPESRPRTFFRLVKVFDRSQVKPLPEFPGGAADLEPPHQPVEGDGLAPLLGPLIEFAAQIGHTLAVEQIAGPGRGYLRPDSRHIGVEAVCEAFSANAQIAVAIHELSHALVRCERTDEDPALSYREEEVVVECVSYTVCRSVGLDISSAAAPYIASWGTGAEIERYAALIDRLARRLEDVVAATGAAAGDAAPVR